jgi:hypothetical protein
VLVAGLLAAGFASGGAVAQSALADKGAGLAPELKTTQTRFVVTTSEEISNGTVVRTIDDPPTGHRWLLMRDAEHPGGPGKLVLSTEAPAGMSASGVFDGAGGNVTSRPITGIPAKAGQSPAPVAQPQIRSGDHLLVEEHSRIADVELTAVALGPAMVGSVFNARLEIGGRVVRVVAEGPGRASFAAERETHR